MAVRPCVRLSSNRVIFLCQAAARSMDASCEVNLKVCRLPIQAKMCRAASQRKKKKKKKRRAAEFFKLRGKKPIRLLPSGDRGRTGISLVVHEKISAFTFRKLDTDGGDGGRARNGFFFNPGPGATFPLGTLFRCQRAGRVSDRDRRFKVHVHAHTHAIERNDLNSVLRFAIGAAAVLVALEQRSREKREPTKLLVALFTMIYPWNDSLTSRFSLSLSPVKVRPRINDRCI